MDTLVHLPSSDKTGQDPSLLKLADVLTYKDQQDQTRKEALAEMHRITDAQGMPL